MVAVWWCERARPIYRRLGQGVSRMVPDAELRWVERAFTLLVLLGAAVGYSQGLYSLQCFGTLFLLHLRSTLMVVLSIDEFRQIHKQYEYR
jgi:hypothetical protein